MASEHTMAPVPPDHPLMQAWERYTASEGFANARRWATDPQHVEGSLWAAFVAGFEAGASTEQPEQREL